MVAKKGSTSTRTAGKPAFPAIDRKKIAKILAEAKSVGLGSITEEQVFRVLLDKRQRENVIAAEVDAAAKALEAEKAERKVRIEDSKKSGAAWAEYFLANDRPDQGGSFRSVVEDAQSLFADRPDDLSAFFERMEEACLPGPRPSENPLIADELDVDDCVRRAQEFSAFLAEYAEHVAEGNGTLDGAAEGYAAATILLHGALTKIGELREAQAQQAKGAHHG